MAAKPRQGDLFVATTVTRGWDPNLQRPYWYAKNWFDRRGWLRNRRVHYGAFMGWTEDEALTRAHDQIERLGLVGGMIPKGHLRFPSEVFRD